MKILVVSQYYYPENFTITNISERLVVLGHQVTVLTGKPNYGFNRILPEYKKINKENINGVEINRVNILPRKKNRISIIFNYLSFYFAGKKWARKCKEKYDVVLSMSLSPVTILGPANLYKKRFNVKHNCYCVDLWPESVLTTKTVHFGSILYKFIYHLSKKLYSKCDEIMISSPSFEDYFRNVLNLKNVPVQYVPQTSLIENINDVIPAKRSDKFNIIYCGNVGLMQGIEKVPEIMSKVVNPCVNFHIIGLGCNVEETIKNITKFKVQDKVFFHGSMPVKKALPILLGSQALYVCLKAEGYVGKTIPNKLNLYMALGKPIIGVFEGDACKILKESKCGILSSFNVEDIAKNIDKISHLVDNDLKNMGFNAQNYYKKNFALDIVSKKIESVLLRNIK